MYFDHTNCRFNNNDNDSLYYFNWKMIYNWVANRKNSIIVKKRIKLKNFFNVILFKNYNKVVIFFIVNIREIVIHVTLRGGDKLLFFNKNNIPTLEDTIIFLTITRFLMTVQLYYFSWNSKQPNVKNLFIVKNN